MSGKWIVTMFSQLRCQLGLFAKTCRTFASNSFRKKGSRPLAPQRSRIRKEARRTRGWTSLQPVFPTHSTRSLARESKINRNGIGSVIFNCPQSRAISVGSSVSTLNSSFGETEVVVVNKARAPVSEMKVASNEDSSNGNGDSNRNRRRSLPSRRWKTRTLTELSDSSLPRTINAGTECQLRPKFDPLWVRAEAIGILFKRSTRN